MDINELLRNLNSADTWVTVNGQLGFITNASRVGNDWSLSVVDGATRSKIGQIRVPVGGSVEIVRIDR